MRKQLAVSTILLALVVGALVAPATDAMNLLPGISWPLYSEREVEVHAGLSQHLKLSDAPTGLSRAVPAIDPAVVPVDCRYGLFNDLRYMRVDLMAQGIDPQRVKRTDMAVWREEQGSMTLDAYTLVLDLQSLTPDEKIIAAEVTHDSTRRESEINLILFRIKSVNHVKTTDRVVSRFLLVDVSNWIEWAVPKMFGEGVRPTNLTEDQRNLVRAAVMEDQGRDTLQFTRPLPRYNLQADFMTRALQGAPAPFQALDTTPYAQALAEVQALRTQLEQQIAEMQAAGQRRVAEIEAERKAAEARAKADAEAYAKAEAEARWPEAIKAKYPDQTGFAFIAVDANGRPTGQPLELHMWQLTDSGWKYNTKSPMTISDGEGTWFWTQPYSWLGIGISDGAGNQPKHAYSIHTTGLRIIAVHGGDSYEVR